ITKCKLVPINASRPVTAGDPKISVSRPRHDKHVVTKTNSPPRRHINRRPSPKASNFPLKVTAVKAPMVNVAKDKGVIDSGCSRHMTGNMSYLSDFEKLNGGYVTFGSNPKGGKISRKGKIRTEKLDFNDVYFVKELKFNLFSVSQMCDKKNSVLFTDTECLVLTPEFKLPDENQVLLRVPRENNMYDVDLKNIVPSGDLTCLFAKATIDESNLLHRRLGHINFKTMNKLVKGNLVRGLPSKVFENNNTCVACKKGKQHRASCMTKPVRSVNQPLYRLHMDLFGRTFVKSLNKKSYCLVVIDDYSRFTWVFFLATKDETSPILKTYITGLENQLSLKVKVIRSDNGTEFKNNDLNQLCWMNGIKREFSVPRTPQQNGIAERKNRTLIEAARTMLADSLLPFHFGLRTPSIGFMRPFGCPVTILNTLDSLGKFNGNVDEVFLVGYSVSKKAGEENVPQYVLFPVWSSGSTNPYNTDGDAAFNEKEPKFEGRKPESEVNVSPSSSAHSKKHNDKTKREAKGKSPVESLIGYRNLSPEFEDFSDKSINKDNDAGTLVPAVRKLSLNSTNTFSVAGLSNVAASSTHGKSSCIDTSQLHDDPNMPELEDITYSDDEDDVGAEADFNNLETSIIVSPIPTTRVHKDYHVTQIIGDLSSATQTRSMTRVDKDQEEPKRVHQAPRAWYETLANYLLENGFQRDKIDQTLFIKREKGDILLVQIYVDDIIFGSTNKDLCKAFEKLMKDKFQMSSMGELTFFLGLQVKQKKDGIFISQDKNVAKILRKFGLQDGKSASTSTDTEKPLLKDPDVYACACFQVTPKASHLHAVNKIFRYLKGKPHLGLWYPKDSPFDLVAYSDSDYVGASLDRKSTTGGCQFLGCRLISWQCKKQTVVATSSTEAEYVAAASCCAQVLWIQNQLLDYGYNFMHTIIYIDNSSTIVNTPRCDEDRLKLIELMVFLLPSDEKVRVEVSAVDLQVSAVRLILLMLVQKFMLFEGIECLPNEEIFAELARMGYEKPSTKLTFYKAFFSSQLKFLIHTILQCMSAKRTSWNEFSSSMASVVIYLSTSRKFNFSKYIFDSLVRNVDSSTKFYMYPRFLQLMIRKQVGDHSSHTIKYSSPALTRKVFANIRRVGKGCYGVETLLFEGMIVEQEVGEGVPEVNVEDVSTAGVAAEGDVSAADDVVPTAVEEPSITSSTPPTPPSQDQPSTSQDKIAQALEITKLKQRVKKLERRNKVSKLKRLKRAGTAQRIETSDDTVMDDFSKQDRMIADMDADVDVILEGTKEVVVEKSADVLSMQDDDVELAELQEVVEVVTTAKLITKVVTAASATITVAAPQLTTAATLTFTTTPSAARKRKGVVIRDPQKTATPSTIIHSEAKSKDKGKGILKKDNDVKRYQALKRKPQTEAQARKNMIIYLRNVAGFKMDYFKGMTYDDIHPIFKKKFNSNKLDEEVKELKRHLQIVPNDKDDVYTEATPLAFKVPVVDYEIYNKHNKPYFKIKRADGSHQLYLNFLSQELEAVRVLWCADYHIHYNTVDFAGRKEISTYKVHSGSDTQ
nr:hypothetical protein [Tanacetum cinerariifolium]